MHPNFLGMNYFKLVRDNFCSKKKGWLINDGCNRCGAWMEEGGNAGGTEREAEK